MASGTANVLMNSYLLFSLVSVDRDFLFFLDVLDSGRFLRPDSDAACFLAVSERPCFCDFERPIRRAAGPV